MASGAKELRLSVDPAPEHHVDFTKTDFTWLTFDVFRICNATTDQWIITSQTIHHCYVLLAWSPPLPPPRVFQFTSVIPYHQKMFSNTRRPIVCTCNEAANEEKEDHSVVQPHGTLDLKGTNFCLASITSASFLAARRSHSRQIFDRSANFLSNEWHAHLLSHGEFRTQFVPCYLPDEKRLASHFECPQPSYVKSFVSLHLKFLDLR